MNEVSFLGTRPMAAEGHSGVSGWTRFFTELSSFLLSCERQHGLANELYTEYAIERLSLSCQSVQALIDSMRTADTELSSMYSNLTQLLAHLHHILQLWRDYSDTLDLQQLSSCYVTATEASHSTCGRPRLQISREQLQHLRSLSFSWTAIADMLMMSQMTVFWRRAVYGMLDEGHFNISDEELIERVQQIMVQHPHIGQSFVCGRLRSMGFRVTRERIRRAIRTCDPLNVALRWPGIATHRRPYSVPGPNSLWHIGMYTSAISDMYWEHTVTVAVIPHTTLYVPTHGFI